MLPPHDRDALLRALASLTARYGYDETIDALALLAETDAMQADVRADTRRSGRLLDVCAALRAAPRITPR